MASRIKGITVEIGGDTSGLEKALSGVNNSIKKTQSQLWDVNNLLKLALYCLRTSTRRTLRRSALSSFEGACPRRRSV